jgi:membrane protein DedA with SNARE-associated domain
MVAHLAALLVVAGLSGWIQDAPETLGNWTYGFGALMAFLEFSSLVGVPAPFEVGVVLSGAVAGEGEIALPPVILLVWLAAAAGESLNFATGDRFGRPFLERQGPRFRVTPARLAWIDERFERRGGLFVLIGRFIPFVRSSMPFAAGASRMTYHSFLPWSIGGNFLWAAAFCSLGYGSYESADEVADGVQRVGALVFVALVALVAAGALFGYLRRRRGTRTG